MRGQGGEAPIGKAFNLRSLDFAPKQEEKANGRNFISIDEAVQACRLAGNSMIPGKAPVASPLKREASLVGLAYLNYIYQNDMANQHFFEAMLLMRAQAPEAGPNPYVALFTEARAATTMAALADVQLVFELCHCPLRPARGETQSLPRHLAQDRRLTLRTSRSTKA